MIHTFQLRLRVASCLQTLTATEPQVDTPTPALSAIDQLLRCLQEPKKAFFESAVLFAGTSGASTHQVTSWATMFSMLLLEEFPAMTYSQ